MAPAKSGDCIASKCEKGFMPPSCAALMKAADEWRDSPLFVEISTS